MAKKKILPPHPTKVYRLTHDKEHTFFTREELLSYVIQHQPRLDTSDNDYFYEYKTRKIWCFTYSYWASIDPFVFAIQQLTHGRLHV